MSIAGRREGLESWVWCAALRAFFARDREVVDLRDGDRVPDEEDESLSLAEAFSSAVGGCSAIMSSLVPRDGGALMLARLKSGSSKPGDVFEAAMSLNERAADFVIG